MRILFVGSYPNPIEPHCSTFFRELIYQFARTGVDCHVIAPVSVTKYRSSVRKIPLVRTDIVEPGVAVKVYSPRIVTYSAKKIGKWNTIRLTLASFDNAVLHYAKKFTEKFDCVYGHFFLGGGLTAAKVGRLLDIPTYIAYGECSYESEIGRSYGDIQPAELKGVHGIISVSSANAEDLKKRGFAEGIPILLSLNSVNKAVFKVKDQYTCREKFGIPQNEFVVGFVGYFIDRKGPGRLLEACRGLDGVKLAFAGKGPQVPTGENVVFCQSLTHDDVADFLNAVDIFVLPTRNEGCCNAVVEAMSCGKPVVSSDLPFNHDIMNDKNSILVDPDNVQQIRDAVIALRDSKQLRDILSKQAEEAVQALSIEHRANNILEFIKRTM